MLCVFFSFARQQHRPVGIDVAQQLSVQDDVGLMAAVLNIWGQIENMTPSVDAYLH